MRYTCLDGKGLGLRSFFAADALLSNNKITTRNCRAVGAATIDGEREVERLRAKCIEGVIRVCVLPKVNRIDVKGSAGSVKIEDDSNAGIRDKPIAIPTSSASSNDC